MNPYLLLTLNQKYWPATPTDFDSTKAIMEKLPHRLKVICALKAAYMAISIWKKHELKKKEEIRVIEKIIELIKEWLAGNATIDEIEKAIKVSTEISTGSSSIAYATVSCVTEAAYCVYNDSTASADLAANAAAHADNVAYYAGLQFYNEWWKRCYFLTQKEFQDKYDLLVRNINGDI